jgi:uncharacterized membrane protein
MKGREIAVSVTLIAGVAVSAVLLVAGLALLFARPAPVEPLAAGALPAAFEALTELDPAAFLHLGLLVLMFTPVARVVVLLMEFVRRREWAFAAVSLGVLFLLTGAVIIGLGGAQ